MIWGLTISYKVIMDINATKNELEAKAYAKITVSPNNLSFKSTASSKQ